MMKVPETYSPLAAYGGNFLWPMQTGPGNACAFAQGTAHATDTAYVGDVSRLKILGPSRFVGGYAGLLFQGPSEPPLPPSGTGGAGSCGGVPPPDHPRRKARSFLEITEMLIRAADRERTPELKLSHHDQITAALFEAEKYISILKQDPDADDDTEAMTSRANQCRRRYAHILYMDVSEPLWGYDGLPPPDNLENVIRALEYENQMVPRKNVCRKIAMLCMHLGTKLLKTNQFEAAEQPFRKAMLYEPDNIRTYTALAKILHRLERLDEAASLLEDFKKRNKDIPVDNPFRFELGLIYHILKRYNEACDILLPLDRSFSDSYRRGTLRHSDFLQLCNLKSFLSQDLCKLGRTTEALGLFDGLPFHPVIEAERGFAHWQVAKVKDDRGEMFKHLYLAIEIVKDAMLHERISDSRWIGSNFIRLLIFTANRVREDDPRSERACEISAMVTELGRKFKRPDRD